jgi:hypothetical protein
MSVFLSLSLYRKLLDKIVLPYKLVSTGNSNFDEFQDVHGNVKVSFWRTKTEKL